MSFFQDFATAYVASANPVLYKQRMEEYERERQKLEANILAKTLSESMFGSSPTGKQSTVDTFNDIKKQISRTYDNYVPQAAQTYGMPEEVIKRATGGMPAEQQSTAQMPLGNNQFFTGDINSLTPEDATILLQQIASGAQPSVQPNVQSSKFLPNPMQGGMGILGNDMDPARRTYLEMLKSAFSSGDPAMMSFALDNLGKMQESHMRDIERTPLLRNLADTNLEVGSPEYSNAILENIRKGGGININFGDNKPLTLEQASSLIDSKGERIKPPAGADWGWVRNYPGGLSWSKQPTAEESSKRAQTQTAIQMANDLKQAIDSGANIDSFWGALQKFRSSEDSLNIMTTAILDKLGIGNDPKDVNAFAITESLSNSVLQAFRGAAVGVEEQDKFNKQLPRPGMPKDLLKQNLELTIKNLQYLEQRREAISRGKQVPDYPTWLKSDTPKSTTPVQPNIGLPEGFSWDSDETE